MNWWGLACTILKKIQAAAPAIRTQFGVTKIGIFGSFARGEQTKKSEVDVLSDYLEALFRRKVDLLTESSISKYIRPYIEKEVIWIEG